MKPKDQIKALAELDDFPIHFQYEGRVSTGNKECYLSRHWYSLSDAIENGGIPPYLTSRDAIVPVILKQPQEIRWRMIAKFWRPETGDNQLDRIANFLFLDAAQLAEALLRASGKWKD